MVHCLGAEILSGSCPFRNMFCSSSAAAYPKEDGKIRPLAVGELIYRVLLRLLLRANEWEKLLLVNQLGVGSSGGVEPVHHWIQLALDRKLDSPYAHLISLDFTNAFNTADRSILAKVILSKSKGLYKVARWAYGQPSDLLFRDSVGDIVRLSSSQGVRQGDPLGPLLFSLAVQPLLKNLQSFLGENHATISYLDDINILSMDDQIIPKVNNFLLQRGCSIALNLAKSRTIALSEINQRGLNYLALALVLLRLAAPSLPIKSLPRLPSLRSYP